MTTLHYQSVQHSANTQSRNSDGHSHSRFYHVLLQSNKSANTELMALKLRQANRFSVFRFSQVNKGAPTAIGMHCLIKIINPWYLPCHANAKRTPRYASLSRSPSSGMNTKRTQHRIFPSRKLHELALSTLLTRHAQLRAEPTKRHGLSRCIIIQSVEQDFDMAIEVVLVLGQVLCDSRQSLRVEGFVGVRHWVTS